MTGLANPECYARALCDCEGKVNLEHYVSESILRQISRDEKGVKVQGLSFQETETMGEYATRGLASRILCERHNGLLSDYDTAGKELFRGLDLMNDAEGKEGVEFRVTTINGDHFERWMLKTLLGSLYSGNMKVGENKTIKGEEPPKLWLDFLYSGDAIPMGQGLYVKPQPYNYASNGYPFVFSMLPLTSKSPDGPPEGEVCGIEVCKFGFKFTLMMLYLLDDVPTLLHGTYYRPSGIQARGNPRKIAFTWEKGAFNEDLIVHKAGSVINQQRGP